MQIKIIAIGSKMPGWVNEVFQVYAKRMPSQLSVKLIELPLGTRSKSRSVEQAIAQESKAILAAIDNDDTVIALEVTGKSISTEKLAINMQQWQLEGRDICLLIGGPDGLSHDCLQRANWHWSLSALTMPHPLVRILLIEQLYRAYSITINHPYHRQG